MPENQETYDVFISFAVEDREIVSAIEEQLQDKQFKVWYSSKFAGGDSIAVEIGEVINRSNYAILILTEEYLQPGWAKTELAHLYNQMAQEKIKLIPIWVNVDLEMLEKHFPLLSSIFAIRSDQPEIIAERVAGAIILTERKKKEYENKINRIEEKIVVLNENQIDSDKLTSNERIKAKGNISKLKGELDAIKDELKNIAKQKGVIPPKEILRKNNRKWITAICSFLLISMVAYGAFYQMTKITPNYDLYTAYLEKADKLLADGKYEEAEEAYRIASLYNPDDKKLQEKLDLLIEANKAIVAEDYEKAQRNFELILKIPASKKLQIERTKQEELNQESLTLTISLFNGILRLTVSGGMPFDDAKNPYTIEGLACRDCINWEKVNENSYTATIDDEVNTSLTIAVLDKEGNIITDYLEVEPEAEIDEEADPESDTTKTEPATKSIEESFIEAKNVGDNFFKNKEYQKAKNAYTEALTYRKGDEYCIAQIAKCDEQIAIMETNALKSIPTNRVAAGTYLQGNNAGLPDEREGKNVSIPTFRLSNTEVTVAQYQKFCNATGKTMPPTPSWGWKEDHPIVNVTWEEANDYAKWVGGRLPTEAEWEFAAKAGKNTTQKYSGSDNLATVAWYKGNAGNKTQAAKSKKPNSLGLMGMTGNVSEWCADWYGKNAYKNNPNSNPKGPSSGRSRVVRGGSYLSVPNAQEGDQLTVTYRNSKKPNTREPYIGFRVVKN